jgi:hypothetical protein
MRKLLTRSMASCVDKILRLRFKIENRRDWFDHQLHCKHGISLPPWIDEKQTEFDTECSNLLSKLDCASNYFINTKSVGKGNYSDHKMGDKLYLECYRKVNKWPDRRQHFKLLFGYLSDYDNTHSDFASNWLRILKKDQKAARFADISSKLWLALCDARIHDKFVCFGTLTVDAEHYAEVWKRASECWRQYIQNVRRHVQSFKYGSYRQAEALGDQCIDYCAVVERGDSTDRLHIHVVLIFNHHCHIEDPNLGRIIPNYKEIKDFDRFWKWGTNDSMRMVRFAQNDAWGKRGFRWPTDEFGYPIRPTITSAMIQYMVGYMLKEDHVKTDEVTQWRIRKTQTLGKTSLCQSLSSLSMNELTSIIKLKIVPIPIYLYDQITPNRMIRNLAIRELYTRMNRILPAGWVKDKSTIFKQLWTTMIHQSCMSKHARIGYLIQKLYGNEDISSSLIDDFLSAKIKIESDHERFFENEQASGVSY